MSTERIQQNEYHFKAEIKQLLDILVHSLYKEQDIFLRELISNASDALTRMRFEMLTNQDVLNPEAELAIHLETYDRDGRSYLVVRDTGIGMSADELVENLGTIAQSGAREFLSRISESDADPGEIIGQFGVGFYSVFMVADEVKFVSRSFRKEDAAAQWISSGDENFRIEEADKEQRGSELHIKLKDSAKDFANEWKLKQVVKKHSDYIGYPIYVGEEQANQESPLWRKNPAEVTGEEYKQFYQQFTMDFEEPLLHIHLTSDAPLHLRALLYIPSTRERSLLHLRQEPGLKLYSHSVLIQEYSQDLLPRWLEFVDGVVESEDIPLNVSRETAQSTRIMRQISTTLRKKIVRELDNLAQDNAGRFGELWKQYGRVFKEGLITDTAAKDDLLHLLRFQSSRSDGELTTLDEYLERMGEEQESIYYVLGDSLDSVKRSPHLEPYLERDIEVLYFADPLDPFLTPVLVEYKNKRLRNIDDASIELDELESEQPDESKESELDDADFNRLVGRFVTTLGDRVLEVRTSRVLRNYPIRLVSSGDESNPSMERVLRYVDENYQIPKRILEINRDHDLIADLAWLVTNQTDNELINLTIEQLFENALVLEGLHPNPTSMLPRVERLLELTASSARKSVER